MKDFADVLGRLRDRKGFTQDRLSKLVGLSRTYLSTLEVREASRRAIKKKRLSTTALRRLCQALASPLGMENHDTSPLDGAAVFELVLSALELDVANPFEYISEGQLALDAQEVWIFTDALAENVVPGKLAETIAALHRGVRYRYFLSEPSEWVVCQQNLQERAPTLSLPDLVMAMHCRSPICLGRIALFDPGYSTRKGTVTLGPQEAIRFMELQPEQVQTIHLRVSSLLDEGYRERLRRGDRHDSMGWVRLVYPE
jgi:transcriptional regulator with XRE-family HTH domain